MSVISNFSVQIIIFLTLAQISNVFNASAVAKDNATEDTDFSFLVTGGYRPAKHTLTKYLVSIRTRLQRKFFGDNHFCGGSIIGPRIILTAAHCMTDGVEPKPRNVHAIRVVVKTSNRLRETDDTLIYDVERIRVHPKYDRGSITNDIAIAKVDQDIDIDGRLAAIIPLTTGPATAKMHCTVVGWGRIMQNGPLAADAIYADIDVHDEVQCRFYKSFRDGKLCASSLRDYELDACNGDSGGPLICDLKLVGLVSYGMGCAAGYPGVYTDIWYFRKWIEENHCCRHAGSSFFTLVIAILLVIFS